MIYLALFSWPLVVIVLFRRLRPAMALPIALIGAYLLLPTGQSINLPLLTTLDKTTIPVLMAAFMALVFFPRDARTTEDNGLDTILPGILPRGVLYKGLLLLAVFGAFMTFVTNRDTVVYGPTALPAMTLYTALSVVQSTVIFLLPLLLARKYLAHPDQQKLLLIILAISGAIYCLPALFEVRMSPQLNRWVYGYFPHSWTQHIRGDGFRPIVFLGHGLQLGIFLTMTGLAAFACKRLVSPEHRWKFLAMGVLLSVTLGLSKNLGATMIFVLCLPFILFAAVRTQLLFAAIIAAIIVTYPVLRSAQLVPVDRVASFVEEQIDPQRARSLRTRLFHEEALLNHAKERALFGWGSHNRWRVHDAQGNDITISDGYWTIEFAKGGWARYLGIFGLISLPIVMSWWRGRRIGVSMETSAICIILAANMIDLIPNAGISVISFLLAGSLIGRLEFQRVEATEQAKEPARPRASRRAPRAAPANTGGAVYTRFAPKPSTRQIAEAKHSE